MSATSHRRRVLGAAACFIAAVPFAGAAFGDDSISDTDLVTAGAQHAITLAAAPGQSKTFDAGLYIDCQSTQHMAGATTLSFDSDASTKPAGTTLSATSVTFDKPSGWPADGAACTNRGTSTDPTAPKPSTITLTAPATDGQYTYLVKYASSDADVKTNGGNSFFTVTLNVTTPTPPPAGDTTPPVIVPTIDGSLGSNGWYRGPVTVTWSVTDPESSDSIDLSGCELVQHFNDDTASATSSCTATSDGGSDTQSVDLKVDQNAPSVSGTAAPAPNGAGWNNTPVTIDWSCTEVGPSGLAAGCPADGTITGEGRTLSIFSGDVYDLAGNFANAESPKVNIDKTAPVVTGTVNVPAYTSGGGEQWWADSAQVTWDAGDPQLDNGDAPSGVTDPAATSLTTAGAGQTATTTATDVAGNTGNGSLGPINIDGAAPTVAMNCGDLPPVIYKGDTVAPLAWTASDEASGLQTAASGTLAVPTNAVGSFTLTTPAPKDNVGHVGATTSCTYSVIFKWSGFFSPINNRDANGNLILNKAKAGSTIPVKFSLGGDQGLDIMAAGYPASGAITCASNASVDAVEVTLSAPTSLRYDAAADQYIYNWRTTSTWTGCRQLVVKLTDGTTHVANFQFTK